MSIQAILIDVITNEDTDNVAYFDEEDILIIGLNSTRNKVKKMMCQ